MTVPVAEGAVPERSDTRLRLFSPAKLNLELRALGRRPDGYRELDTEMVLIDFGDDLELERTAEPGVRLELSGPAASADIPTDGGNLAVRAAERAWSVFLERGGAGGLELRLHKRVPSGAGLGGGSSNAATALRGVLELCGLDRDPTLDGAWRAGVLAELGSDTVFFDAARDSGRARCTGRGEVVEALEPLPADARFHLATPRFHAATAGVYGRLSELREAGASKATPPGSEANDLAPAAFDLEPRLAELQSRLGASWQLTGSGSTFFHRGPADAEHQGLHDWRLWIGAGPWRAEHWRAGGPS